MTERTYDKRRLMWMAGGLTAGMLLGEGRKARPTQNIKPKSPYVTISVGLPSGNSNSWS